MTRCDGQPSDQPDSREADLRAQICEIGRRMYERGYAAANDGNISARLDAGRVLCTPRLVSKGFMQPDDLSLVDLEGNQLSGRRPRSTEVLLHLAVYKARPDVGAVVHCHSPYATAFAIAGQPLPSGLLVEVEWHLGPVPLAPFGMPGGPGVAASIDPFLKDHHAILLANHGALTYGADLTEAYFRTEILEAYCRALVLARALGPLKPLSAETLRAFLELKRQAGLPDPRYDPR